MGKARREARLQDRLRAHLERVDDPSLRPSARKRAARQAACLAERLGLLKRPRGCRRCGRRTMLERHHADHLNDPLGVEYLCRACHLQADSDLLEVRALALWDPISEAM